MGFSRMMSRYSCGGTRLETSCRNAHREKAIGQRGSAAETVGTRLLAELAYDYVRVQIYARRYDHAFACESLSLQRSDPDDFAVFGKYARSFALQHCQIFFAFEHALHIKMISGFVGLTAKALNRRTLSRI